MTMIFLIVISKTFDVLKRLTIICRDNAEYDHKSVFALLGLPKTSQKENRNRANWKQVSQSKCTNPQFKMKLRVLIFFAFFSKLVYSKEKPKVEAEFMITSKSANVNACRGSSDLIFDCMKNNAKDAAKDMGYTVDENWKKGSTEEEDRRNLKAKTLTNCFGKPDTFAYWMCNSRRRLTTEVSADQGHRSLADDVCHAIGTEVSKCFGANGSLASESTLRRGCIQALTTSTLAMHCNTYDS